MAPFVHTVVAAFAFATPVHSLAPSVPSRNARTVTVTRMSTDGGRGSSFTFDSESGIAPGMTDIMCVGKSQRNARGRFSFDPEFNGLGMGHGMSPYGPPMQDYGPPMGPMGNPMGNNMGPPMQQRGPMGGHMGGPMGGHMGGPPMRQSMNPHMRPQGLMEDMVPPHMRQPRTEQPGPPMDHLNQRIPNPRMRQNTRGPQSPPPLSQGMYQQQYQQQQQQHQPQRQQRRQDQSYGPPMGSMGQHQPQRHHMQQQQRRQDQSYGPPMGSMGQRQGQGQMASFSTETAMGPSGFKFSGESSTKGRAGGATRITRRGGFTFDSSQSDIGRQDPAQASATNHDRVRARQFDDLPIEGYQPKFSRGFKYNPDSSTKVTPSAGPSSIPRPGDFMYDAELDRRSGPQGGAQGPVGNDLMDRLAQGPGPSDDLIDRMAQGGGGIGDLLSMDSAFAAMSKKNQQPAAAGRAFGRSFDIASGAVPEPKAKSGVAPGIKQVIDTDKTGKQKPAGVSLGNERFPYDSDLDLDVGKAAKSTKTSPTTAEEAASISKQLELEMRLDEAETKWEGVIHMGATKVRIENLEYQMGITPVGTPQDRMGAIERQLA